MTFRLITLALLVFTASACGQQDPDKQVNLLITEASQLYRQGIDAEDPKDTITLLEQALANLDRIVQDFPGTDAAVQLATSDRIRDLKRESIRLYLFLARKTIDDAEEEAARFKAQQEALPPLPPLPGTQEPHRTPPGN